jgi:hypothetical protein
MLRVITLSVSKLNIIMPGAIILNYIVLVAVMLNLIMLCVVMLNVNMLCVVTQRVIMPSVKVLSVHYHCAEHRYAGCCNVKYHYAECQISAC